MLFQGHIPFIFECFICDTNIGNEDTAFISIIRNPINRLICSYYYVRGQSGGWRAKKGKFIIERVMNKTNNLSLDQCVYEMYYFNNNICELSINFYTSWFCGMYCIPFKSKLIDRNLNRTKYLNKAIYNINTYFSWIGILEYYDHSFLQFLYKFEKYTNLKFSNLTIANYFNYSQKLKSSRIIQGYSQYTKPSKDTFKLLQKLNDLDMILYSYIIRKFQRSACCISMF